MKCYIFISLCVVFLSNAVLAQSKWYRGNTHTHTKLSGHGDATPEEVVAWYHAHQYNFLVLSEHNRFIDPEKVELPTPLRQDFILVPGLELTGKKNIHTTALNVKEVPNPNFDSEHPHEIVQNHVDLILGLGGKPIINHPNWIYALSGKQLLQVNRVEMMELYNGHPDVNNAGDKKHESTERIWDQLLVSGKKMYAVASDDAHHFHSIKPELSNPGRGWIMVKASELSANALLESLGKGHFYASNGVMLKDVSTEGQTYKVEIDEEASATVLKNENPAGKPCKIKAQYSDIIFLGPKLKVLARSKNKPSATFDLKTLQLPFVRAKISLCRKVGSSYRIFHAWTQPYFKE